MYEKIQSNLGEIWGIGYATIIVSGVRNALIDNLNLLADRNDVGQLWENLMIVERRKWLEYQGNLASLYFWRTHSGAEVDLIQESEGRFFAFEYKWRKTQVRPPQSFLDAYPQAHFEVVTPETYSAHVGARP